MLVALHLVPKFTYATQLPLSDVYLTNLLIDPVHRFTRRGILRMASGKSVAL